MHGVFHWFSFKIPSLLIPVTCFPGRLLRKEKGAHVPCGRPSQSEVDGFPRYPGSFHTPDVISHVIYTITWTVTILNANIGACAVEQRRSGASLRFLGVRALKPSGRELKHCFRSVRSGPEGPRAIPGAPRLIPRFFSASLTVERNLPDIARGVYSHLCT